MFFGSNWLFVQHRRALFAAILIASHCTASVWAQAPAPTPAAERSVADWLLRMHEASRKRAYQGTFVVTSAIGMSSAKIWHACDGAQQYERVDALTGPPRSTFRHNQNVITFNTETRTARTETRESLGFFQGVVPGNMAAVEEFYTTKALGNERVAGVEADIVQLTPKDSLRFGYRLWSEKKSGLVVKMQTIDEHGNVLEQAAFSELQLDAPVRIDRLAAMMANTQGYKLEKSDLIKTTAAAEGWSLRSAVPGFKATSCHKRVSAPGLGEGAMQWVFSDGLASVSLFVEPIDPKAPRSEGQIAMGATHSISRKLDGHWLTALGEVPLVTLRAFASGLQRK